MTQNTANHRIADNIALLKTHRRKFFHLSQTAPRVRETADLRRRQINLIQIASHNHAAVLAETRQKHHHLRARRVLRLVKNNIRGRQSASAQKRERRDLNRAETRIPRKRLGGQKVGKRVM